MRSYCGWIVLTVSWSSACTFEGSHFTEERGGDPAMLFVSVCKQGFREMHKAASDRHFTGLGLFFTKRSWQVIQNDRNRKRVDLNVKTEVQSAWDRMFHLHRTLKCAAVGGLGGNCRFLPVKINRSDLGGWCSSCKRWVGGLLLFNGAPWGPRSRKVDVASVCVNGNEWMSE